MGEIKNLPYFKKSYIHLVGDLNLDLKQFNAHHHTNTFIDKLANWGLIPLITKPTRIQNNSATILDIQFSSFNNFLSSSIINLDLSDHLPTHTQFNFEIKGNSLSTFTTRDTSESNCLALKNLLILNY